MNIGQKPSKTYQKQWKILPKTMETPWKTIENDGTRPDFGQDSGEDSLQNWEPPREGRQLRTRDRSDGHGFGASKRSIFGRCSAIFSSLISSKRLRVSWR